MKVGDEEQFELLLSGVKTIRVPFPDHKNKSVRLLGVQVVTQEGHNISIPLAPPRVWHLLRRGSTHAIVDGDDGWIYVFASVERSFKAVRVLTNMGSYYHHLNGGVDSH